RRGPGVDGRPEIQRQAGAPAARRLRLDPGAQPVDPGLQLELLGRLGAAASEPVAVAAGALDKLIDVPGTAGRPVGRRRSTEGLETAVGQDVGVDRRW